MNAEKAVIGAALLGGSRIVDDCRLSPSDFHEPINEQMWQFILDLHTQQKPIDSISVGTGRPGWGAYVFECTSECATPANAEFYASIVRERAAKSRLMATGSMLVQDSQTELSSEKLLEAAFLQLDSIVDAHAVDVVEFIPQIFRDYRETLNKRQINGTSGLRRLDKVLNGFRDGALYVIGARPATGKSVIGLQIAFGLARPGSELPSGEKAGAVVFFSLEMSKRELMNRLVAQVYELDLGRIDRGELTALEQGMIDKHTAAIGRMLSINDRAGQSLASIRNFARSIKRSGTPLKAIVIDYLGLISDVQSGRSRYEAMTMVSGALKAMAKDFDVPVIALAQLNRNVEGRKESAPVMADLRDSGSIEQDADVVMLLHRRAGLAAVDENDLNVLQVAIAKNRHGQTGIIDFRFEGQFSRITDPLQ
jgi:replicative DNA helicase